MYGDGYQQLMFIICAKIKTFLDNRKWIIQSITVSFHYIDHWYLSVCLFHLTCKEICKTHPKQESVPVHLWICLCLAVRQLSSVGALVPLYNLMIWPVPFSCPAYPLSPTNQPTHEFFTLFKFQSAHCIYCLHMFTYLHTCCLPTYSTAFILLLTTYLFIHSSMHSSIRSCFHASIHLWTYLPGLSLCISLSIYSYNIHLCVHLSIYLKFLCLC